MIVGRGLGDTRRDLGGVGAAGRFMTLSALSTYVALMVTVPVLLTPYRADDEINRNYLLEHARGDWSHWDYFYKYTTQWMTNEGRFFPGSVAWGQLVYSVTTARVEYKLFLVLLALAAFTATGLVVARLTGQPVLAALLVLAMAPVWQIRNFYDGISAFAGLLPMTVLLVFTASYLLCRYRAWKVVLLAAALWSVVLMTYEVAILLTPVLAAVTWWQQRTRRSVLALVVPAMLVTAVVLRLRATMPRAPAPGYTVGLDPHDVLVTYVKQLSAALPLSQFWYPGAADMPAVSPRLALISLLVLGVPALCAQLLLRRVCPAVPTRALSFLSLLGLWCWLASGAFVAVTVRWQTELPPGQGYLAVVWGYVGVALLLTAGWLTLHRSSVVRPSVWRRSLLHGFAVLLSLAAAGTFASNLALADALSRPAPAPAPAPQSLGDLSFAPESGFDGRETDGQNTWWWATSPEGRMTVGGDAGQELLLTLTINPPPCHPAQVRLDGVALRVAKPVTREIRLVAGSDGTASISLAVQSAGCQPAGDPRTVFVSVANPSVSAA